jgi:hypothetical protein
LAQKTLDRAYDTWLELLSASGETLDPDPAELTKVAFRAGWEALIRAHLTCQASACACHSGEPKITKEELATLAAIAVVKAWESIPSMLDGMRQFGLDDNAINAFRHDLEVMAGGEDLYDASKAFLAEQTAKYLFDAPQAD